MKFLSLIIDLPRSAYTITTRPSLSARIGQKMRDLVLKPPRRRRRSLPQTGGLHLPSVRAFCLKLTILGIVATVAIGVIRGELVGRVGQVSFNFGSLVFNQVVGGLAV